MSDNKKFSVELDSVQGTLNIYHNTSVGKFPIYSSIKPASKFTAPLTLSLKFNGDLILRDSNMQNLWITENNNVSSANSLTINNNGNLEIYSISRQLIWQSQSLNFYF